MMDAQPLGVEKRGGREGEAWREERKSFEFLKFNYFLNLRRPSL